jgi:hypothetical protein
MGVQRRVGRSIEGHTAGAGSGSSWARPAAADPLAGEVSVGLAGDVTLEDADDLGSRPSFVEATGDVGAGAGIGTEAGEHDAPQGMVGLAVPASVEPVPAGDLSGGGLERGDTAQMRPGRFAAHSLGIVAGGDTEDGGVSTPTP